MSFGDPLLDRAWSVLLLGALAVTGIVSLWKRPANFWAYASLCVGLFGAFPAAQHLRLPTAWASLSPLMLGIGVHAGAVSMLIGALAWGLSVVALLARYNWRPAREIGGVVPAYLGGLIGVCTVGLNLWRLLE